MPMRTPGGTAPPPTTDRRPSVLGAPDATNRRANVRRAEATTRGGVPDNADAHGHPTQRTSVRTSTGQRRRERAVHRTARASGGARRDGGALGGAGAASALGARNKEPGGACAGGWGLKRSRTTEGPARDGGAFGRLGEGRGSDGRLGLGRPAHPYLDAFGGRGDLHVVGEAGDDGQAQLRGALTGEAVLELLRVRGSGEAPRPVLGRDGVARRSPRSGGRRRAARGGRARPGTACGAPRPPASTPRRPPAAPRRAGARRRRCAGRRRSPSAGRCARGRAAR